MKLTNFFTKRSLAVFGINILASFLMAVIPHLNLSKNLISPSPAKVDKMQIIEPKLEDKKNNFSLKQNLIPQVSAGSGYDGADAYGVINFETGEILSSKNLDKKHPIASITKLLTAVVALDLSSLDEKFTVSENAEKQIPTKMALKAGESYSLENLLKFALISSANDAAEVIKDGINQKYGSEIFIKAMNEKARILGLKNSNFTSPQGFDNPENYSSVEDLAILSHYALANYPFLDGVVNTQLLDLTGQMDKRFYLQNWNSLLGVYPGAKGIKIGNTREAGVCNIILSERDGKKVMVIVLGAPGVLERDLWASQLLDLGFQKLGVPPANITEANLKAKYASWIYPS